MQNRPVLWILGFLIDNMVQLDDHQTTLEMMEWALWLNPNDNQGFHSEMVHACLRLNRNDDVIALCEHYLLDDNYPDILRILISASASVALWRCSGKANARWRIHI